MTSAGRGPPLWWRSGDEDVAGFRHQLAAEEGKYGQYAPVVVLAVGKAELLENGLHMAFYRARAEVDLLGDRPVGSTLGQQGEHGAFAVGELVQRRTSATDEALHDLRVEG